MASKPMLKCSICGKEYYACATCAKIKTYTPWRMVCDTLPHYVIYLAIAEYTRTGDKEKAKEELSKCDLSDLGNLKPSIQNVIKEIMTEEKSAEVETAVRIKPKKFRTVKETTVEPTSDVEIKDEVVKTDIEAIEVKEESNTLPGSEIEAIPVKRRKRNTRKNRNKITSTIIEGTDDENKNDNE